MANVVHFQLANVISHTNIPQQKHIAYNMATAFLVKHGIYSWLNMAIAFQQTWQIHFIEHGNCISAYVPPT